ncbi:hypothetical protein GGR56DRAFT_673536 [Xylariaceae sp. FL0804]|nr:hypothetical protein GGR56DRAFT_673536 [Xylariaceae sp. FL0804]
MAEPATVVAGLWAAEEVVSTGVQAGAATYAVAKPTMPLKATFTQIGSTSDDSSKSSLVRSHHTVTIVGGRAYIFGGQMRGGQLADNSIHAVALPATTKAGAKQDAAAGAPDYQVLPAIGAEKSDPVPAARAGHAACALGDRIAVHGGRGEDGAPLPADDAARVWLYDTVSLTWEVLAPAAHPERAPPPRSGARLLPHDGNLVLCGGRDAGGAALADVWHFNGFTKVWNQLPQVPSATDASAAAIAGDTLYVLDGAADGLSCNVHTLDVKLYGAAPPTWATASAPTNPLAPGPRPRRDAGLLAVTTGYGRNYLLYFLGAAGEGQQPCSDLWTYQLPSSKLSDVKASVNMAEAIKPAKLKDQIRSALGADTGAASWAEVEVLPPPDDPQARAGKAHPGPRSAFGCDVAGDGGRVVLWGGVNGEGSPEGDGWVIQLS